VTVDACDTVRAAMQDELTIQTVEEIKANKAMHHVRTPPIRSLWRSPPAL